MLTGPSPSLLAPPFSLPPSSPLSSLLAPTPSLLTLAAGKKKVKKAKEAVCDDDKDKKQ